MPVLRYRISSAFEFFRNKKFFCFWFFCFLFFMFNALLLNTILNNRFRITIPNAFKLDCIETTQEYLRPSRSFCAR